MSTDELVMDVIEMPILPKYVYSFKTIPVKHPTRRSVDLLVDL